MLSRTEAQQRADAIGTFQRELERLEQEGVVALSDDQRQAIRDHHQALVASFGAAFDIDRDARAKQLSLGMRVASFLGALALSASAFLLFYNFWGRLTTTVQILILVTAAGGTFAAALWVRGRDTSGYFTKLVAMVAVACFILDITVLGRIFNMTPSDTALLPWAAVALLLAYTCDLRLLLGAGIVLCIAWVSTRTAAWNDIYWPHAGERPENIIAAGALAFVVPLFVRHERWPEFPPVYRILGLLAALLPMLFLSTWGAGSYAALDEETVEGFYQIVGFVACAATIWLGIRREWRETVNVGVAMFALFLYVRLFDWWWEAMPKYLFFLMLGAVAVGILLVLRAARAAGVRVLGSAAT